MPRIIRPTFKQKKFVKEYLKTGVMYKSAMKAYDTQNKEYASQIAHDTLHHPVVQKYIAEIMEDRGLTDERIADKLNRIIDAGTTESALKTTTPANAMDAIKFAAKLKDIIPAEKIEQKTARLNIDLKGKSQPELEEVLSKLLDETRQFKQLLSKK